MGSFGYSLKELSLSIFMDLTVTIQNSKLPNGCTTAPHARRTAALGTRPVPRMRIQDDTRGAGRSYDAVASAPEESSQVGAVTQGQVQDQEGRASRAQRW